MFRRSPGAGSMYWLGHRDSTGSYLDGAGTYRLSVPQPMPVRLFWSVTFYDAETRSQIQTDRTRQSSARSSGSPTTPATPWSCTSAPALLRGDEARWIKTMPGRGRFVYMRLYGPEGAPFTGDFRPDDFEPLD